MTKQPFPYVGSGCFYLREYFMYAQNFFDIIPVSSAQKYTRQ